MEEPESRYKSVFEEMEEIGYGADGTVFKCRHILDGNIYAVKSISFHRNDMERVLREVKSMVLMDHPNIVRYYQCWIEKASESSLMGKSSGGSSESGGSLASGGSPALEGSAESGNSQASNGSRTPVASASKIASPDLVLYIVMELCDKKLEELVRSSAIEPAKVWQLFQEIVSAVAHLHGKFVVHRDLTRNNIFLKDGKVKVGDFGLARILGVSEHESSCTPDIGVCYYIPPEMKENRVSFQSDVYSLGVLFYELLSDFGTESERHDWLPKLKNKTLCPFWIKNRSFLTPILMQMVNDNLFERPTAQELYDELENLQATAMAIFAEEA